MTSFNPIHELTRLGYTPREAGFLCLVGRLSGYFLSRQFNTFVQRKPGAIVCQFLAKTTERKHVQVLDFGQNYYVYHLKSRLIYELLQCPESQHRRNKGDDEIRTKLMVLDYALDNLDLRFLALRADKHAYFCEELGIEQSAYASFVDRFPIFFNNHHDVEFPIFTYFDPGTATVKPFARYLKVFAQAFEKLDQFQVLYGALSSRNFVSAEATFHKAFPDIKVSKRHRLLPYGPEHLVNFFHAQRLWDENSPNFQQEHLAIIREGERIYIRPEHSRFRLAAQRGSDQLQQEIEQVCGIKQVNGQFSSRVIEGAFPLLRCRQRGERAQTTAFQVAI